VHSIPTRGIRSRNFVLLAPAWSSTRAFSLMDPDPVSHDRLLSEAQRLRGRIYLADGAIQRHDLTADGRHLQHADSLSWHLLTVDGDDRVLACARYLPHAPNVSFTDLTVFLTPLAQSGAWGGAVRRAVEEDLERARHRRYGYVELGGWAISEELRCTREAVRMIGTIYALAAVLGGALGVSTATSRHGSSSILRRVGGRPLMSEGVPLPPYYDERYSCEMELLRFDSTQPNPIYGEWVNRCRSDLKTVRVVRGCRERLRQAC